MVTTIVLSSSTFWLQEMVLDVLLCMEHIKVELTLITLHHIYKVIEGFVCEILSCKLSTDKWLQFS